MWNSNHEDRSLWMHCVALHMYYGYRNVRELTFDDAFVLFSLFFFFFCDLPSFVCLFVRVALFLYAMTPIQCHAVICISLGAVFVVPSWFAIDHGVETM